MLKINTKWRFLKNLLIIQSILIFDFFFKPNFLLFKSLALSVSETLISKKQKSFRMYLPFEKSNASIKYTCKQSLVMELFPP